MSSNDADAVMHLSDQWYAALNAMFHGNPEPLKDVFSHAEDVTYMPAQGGLLVGWEAVYADWVKQAEKSLGAKAEPFDRHVTVGTDLAVSCNAIRGQVQLPDGSMAQIEARASSVYRKEGGVWKMIAHHVDRLMPWEDVVEKA